MNPEFAGERRKREGLLEWALGQWEEGGRHGFPGCCRARWILAHARPQPLAWLSPGVAGRLRRVTPRWSIADGMVPCEWHLLKWVWTGSREGWRTPSKEPKTTRSSCCLQREGVERSGAALLRREILGPDEIFHEATVVWELLIGEEGISIQACPWCGTRLD